MPIWRDAHTTFQSSTGRYSKSTTTLEMKERHFYMSMVYTQYRLQRHEAQELQ